MQELSNQQQEIRTRKSTGSRSRGSSKRSRQVNEEQTKDYLKRPLQKIANANKELKNSYEKKHLQDSKFDYIRQLKQKRKNQNDSISSHGGTDDQDFNLSETDDKKQQAKVQSTNKRSLRSQENSHENNQTRLTRTQERLNASSGEMDKEKKKQREKQHSVDQQVNKSQSKSSNKAQQEDYSESKSCSQSLSESSGKSQSIKEGNKEKLKQSQQVPKEDDKMVDECQQQQKNKTQKIQTQAIPQSKNSEMVAQEKQHQVLDVDEQSSKQDIHHQKESSDSSEGDKSDQESQENSQQVEKVQKKGKKNSNFIDRVKDVIQNKGQQKEVKMATFKGRRKVRGRRSKSNRVSKSKSQKQIKTRRSKNVSKSQQKKEVKQLQKNKKKNNQIDRSKQKQSKRQKRKQQKSKQKQQEIKQKQIRTRNIQRSKQRQMKSEINAQNTFKQIMEQTTIKTRGKTPRPESPKKQKINTKPHKTNRHKTKVTKETQLNLRGEVANMSNPPPIMEEKNNKDKSPQNNKPTQSLINTESPLRFEAGQQRIEQFMQRKNQSETYVQKKVIPLETKILNQNVNKSAQVADKVPVINYPIEPFQQKRNKLQLNSRVIVQSILYFGSNKEKKLIKPQREKVVRYETVVEETDEEPIEYVYRQRRSRPNDRRVRRYRKLPAEVQESDVECNQDYYVKPSYRKVRTIKYSDHEDYHRRDSRKKSKGESRKKLKRRHEDLPSISDEISRISSSSGGDRGPKQQMCKQQLNNRAK